ncbi:MAG: hypothetical protein WDZ94_04505 [Patescibacteria group bacterium]
MVKKFELSLKNSKGICALISVFLLISLFTFVKNAYAQESPQPSYAKDTIVDKELALIKEQYQFLREETKSFQERVDSERSNFYAFLAVVLVVPSLIGIGTYLGLWIKISRMTEDKLNEVILNNSDKLKKNAEQWALSIVDESFGFHKKILILSPKSFHSWINEKLVSVLENRGFNKVSVKTITNKIGSPDLIVFYLDETTKEKLEDLIDHLEKNGPLIPVIAYANKQISSEKFSKYDLRSYANSPLTLASWVFNILSSRAVKERKHGNS